MANSASGREPITKHRWIRLAGLLLVDTVLVNAAMMGALFIRFEGTVPSMHWEFYRTNALFFTSLWLVSLGLLGLYNRLWQYASIGELVSVIGAVTLGSGFVVGSQYLFFNGFVQPRSVLVLAWMLNIILIGGSRLIWRLYRDGRRAVKGADCRDVLIVGAGDAGVMVAKDMDNHYRGDVRLLGFVDDDPEKQGKKLLGLPVLGSRADVTQLVERYRVDEIIIAIPSATGSEIREIVSLCQETDAAVKILPGIFDLLDGNVTVSQIRDVQVEDLLGRDPVKVDLASMSQYIADQVVLVTGAGGSIGSELCRQVAGFRPAQLLLLDVCENNVYDIEMEMRNCFPKLDVVPLVKDVRDRASVDGVFKFFGPSVVFHAAAHKHVPLMESNPEEAIKNNVMGTFHVAQAANLNGAQRFVLISTDKAVHPTSVMGASKRVAEMLIQHMDATSRTRYVAVRFGNVLASRGSVVPLFKKQIAAGGPLTVTDSRMMRYFMTIPEAVQLVIQAGAIANGGEIFVLDMGEPVKIMDLAKSLIRLSGFSLDEIPVKITGMRPGEKLFEELLTAEEGVDDTDHSRIFVAKPTDLPTEQLDRTMRDFVKGCVPQDADETEAYLRCFLPAFRPLEDAEVPASTQKPVVQAREG